MRHGPFHHRFHGHEPRGFGHGEDHRRHWGRGVGQAWGQGGGRRGRMFEQGALRFVILRLIEEKPRHGYEIIKAIEEAFGGGYTPSPGIVYPTLTLLEEQSFARVSSEEGGKKAYSLTDEGKAHLEENKAQADAVLERIKAARQAYGGGPPAPIVRAWENLRMAGRMRLQKGELTEDQIAAIADLLDDAAKKIEKL
jgi:DNA-binding PadR family transcriptional regulator